MGHVDALSRCVGAITDSIDVDFQLKAAQNRDHFVVKLQKSLEETESSRYEMQDGIVYRKDKSSGRLLFYVPTEMENNIIRHVHEKFGHFSTAKCYDRIRLHYWFPDMRKKIDSFIKNCLQCIMHAPPKSKLEKSLYNIPKKPVPFHTLHIDHFGPLPAINSKRKHVLVIIDAFTKFVRLYSTVSTSTREVCGALDKYFNYYSRPVRIVSDRGTCFTSSEFKTYLEQKNINHVKVATASPQANGQVERVNRVLKAILAKITDPVQHADWCRKLSDVEFAINNTVSQSTGFTPSRLLFGVDQRGTSVDYLTEYLECKDINPLTRDLELERDKALAAILKSQERNAKWVEQHCKPAKEYSVGDYVVIRNIDTTIGTNKKLVQSYRGPYVIHKILPNDRYVVKDVEGCQLTQIPYEGIIESRHLKLWRAINNG